MIEQQVPVPQTRPADDVCWHAVIDRDKSYNGRFVFAVRSTGVFCRPSCPARRPRRENVTFFDLPRDAEAAGFRACLRCRPLDSGSPEEQAKLVEQACRIIEASPERLSLDALGKEVGVSPFHLQRTFKRLMGISPRQYGEAHRSSRLKKGLQGGDSVTGAMYDAGYGSSSRLYESAHDVLGMTPSRYRRGGEGMKIAYTTLQSRLGRLLVAATERGICAVSLGDSDEQLLFELGGEYPGAEIHRDDPGLGTWASAVLEYVDGTQTSADLPLDLAATAFQHRVWEELRTIPYGSTRSYGEIARSIGEPGAARAVAQACASNRVALLIPCHRVVREGGAPGGYRWGIERKRALLRQEEQAAAHETEPVEARG